MGRPRKVLEPKTYSALIAARLRELRVAKSWSVEEWCAKMAAAGAGTIPAKTAYSYERGKDDGHGGANMSPDLYPFVAEIYGFSTPFEWLPRDAPKASETIGEQLLNAVNQHLKDSGLSVHAFAKEVGIKQPILYRWIMGERDIRLATASKIASHLNLRLASPV